MSFPFNTADSKIADGRLDHRALLALAISRQADGPTARQMLESSTAKRAAQSNPLVDPMALRMRYFAKSLGRIAPDQAPSGGFCVPREKSTDQRTGNNEHAVYQDVSANRKLNDVTPCTSDAVLAVAGQENLRHI